MRYAKSIAMLVLFLSAGISYAQQRGDAYSGYKCMPNVMLIAPTPSLKCPSPTVKRGGLYCPGGCYLRGGKCEPDWGGKSQKRNRARNEAAGLVSAVPSCALTNRSIKFIWLCGQLGQHMEGHQEWCIAPTNRRGETR